MSVATLPNFLQIFTERRQCFTELLALSHEQLSRIDESDYTGLLTVLGHKQRVIGRLEEIARAQNQFGNSWHAHRNALSPAMRQACDTVLAETEIIISELLDHERSGTESLVRRRDETHLELSGLAAGTRAQTAYRDSLAPAAPRHLDVDQ